jgi:lipopolysaccharide biosynthesis regulator YciM
MMALDDTTRHEYIGAVTTLQMHPECRRCGPNLIETYWYCPECVATKKVVAAPRSGANVQTTLATFVTRRGPGL